MRFGSLAVSIFSAILVSGAHPSDAEASKSRKKVFILHSYELGHVCGQPQHEGVVHALSEAGFGPADVEYRVYAMDTKRTNNTPALIATQAKVALDRIRRFAPDVLVTLDDNAFRAVALPLAGTNLPIVFSGMNNQPEYYDDIAPWMNSRRAPGHNITGVYEKIHFVTAVKIQKKIQPSMNRIRIFSDNSPTGKALVRQIRLELERDSIPAEYDFVITDSWEEYQRAVRATNEEDVDALYPVALRLTDRAGKTHTANEILTWTANNSARPSIPLNFAFVRLGLFGGAGVDFNAMGKQAGQMVARILRGESAGRIGIEEAERYALVFHLDRARTLGITIPDEILLAAEEVYRN